MSDKTPNWMAPTTTNEVEGLYWVEKRYIAMVPRIVQFTINTLDRRLSEQFDKELDELINKHIEAIPNGRKCRTCTGDIEDGNHYEQCWGCQYGDAN